MSASLPWRSPGDISAASSRGRGVMDRLGAARRVCRARVPVDRRLGLMVARRCLADTPALRRRVRAGLWGGEPQQPRALGPADPGQGHHLRHRDLLPPQRCQRVPDPTLGGVEALLRPPCPATRGRRARWPPRSARPGPAAPPAAAPPPAPWPWPAAPASRCDPPPAPFCLREVRARTRPLLFSKQNHPVRLDTIPHPNLPSTRRPPTSRPPTRPRRRPPPARSAGRLRGARQRQLDPGWLPQRLPRSG